MRDETLSLQGLTVAYKVAGQGPVLLLLHGWGSSAARWQKIVKEVAERGVRVVALDLPGFGDSTPPHAVWGIKEYAEFVRAFLEKMEEKNVVLAGHSVGGQIALQFALDNPSMVKKLVLMAPAAVRRPPGMREQALKGISKVLGYALYVAPVNVQTNARRIGYRLLRRPDYLRTYGVMREVFQKVIRQDLTPMFPSVSVPTVLIWGDKDRITPLEDARLMEDEISGAKLHIIKGSGHNLHVDAPKELAETLSLVVKS